MDNIIEWLTSIPGILIGSGVLLLIVALVIFIVTSRPKKAKEAGDNLETFNMNNVSTEPAVNPVPTNFGINNPNTDLNKPSFSQPQNESSLKPLGIDNTIVMNPVPNTNPDFNNFTNNNNTNNANSNINNNSNNNNNINNNMNDVPPYQAPVMPNIPTNEPTAIMPNQVPPVEIKPVVDVTPVVPITPVTEAAPVEPTPPIMEPAPTVEPVKEVIPAVEVTPVAEASEPNLSNVPGESFVKAPEKEEIETLDF
jgi:hypothetical protein